MNYTLILLPDVAHTISSLPAPLKQQVRAALDEIKSDPHTGKPLRDDLWGFWTYRVRRFRIIYRIRHQRIEIEVVAVGSRKNIYERVSSFVRNLPRE